MTVGRTSASAGISAEAVEVYDSRSAREGEYHAQRALVGVRQRQYGEQDILLVEVEQRRNDRKLHADVIVRQHDALGARRGARRIYYYGQIVGRRNARLALFEDGLRYYVESLGAYDDVHALYCGLRQFGEELVRDEYGFGFGVGYYHVQLLAREVGQYGYGYHAGCGYGEIGYAPVGHAAAENGDLVAGTYAGLDEQLLHVSDASADLFVGNILCAEHGVGYLRREFFDAVLNYLV